jgi:hypothetical protein
MTVTQEQLYRPARQSRCRDDMAGRSTGDGGGHLSKDGTAAPGAHDLQGAEGPGPLLVDRIPGESRGFPFSQVGQGLMTLGVVALLAGILAVLLSAPSLEMGWEGSWYVPRGELAFVLPVSLALVAAGAVLYMLGRNERRRSPGTVGDPASPHDQTGTAK